MQDKENNEIGGKKIKMKRKSGLLKMEGTDLWWEIRARNGGREREREL